MDTILNSIKGLAKFLNDYATLILVIITAIYAYFTYRMAHLMSKQVIADMIDQLRCPVIMVGRNRLGTLNHVLLTVEALQKRGIRQIKVVLMDAEKPDVSSATNLDVLKEFMGNTGVFAVPYLGKRASRADTLKENSKILKKTIAQVLESDNFCLVLSKVRKQQRQKINKKGR